MDFCTKIVVLGSNFNVDDTESGLLIVTMTVNMKSSQLMEKIPYKLARYVIKIEKDLFLVMLLNLLGITDSDQSKTEDEEKLKTRKIRMYNTRRKRKAGIEVGTSVVI